MTQTPNDAEGQASVDGALMATQVEGLAELNRHWSCVLSNASALIMETMADLNWAGFYLMRDGQLALGPFQGKVACVNIEIGRGVCGTAAELDQTQVVADVHAFPGHIACDSASRSEVVVPLRSDGHVIGVLDIDSPLPNRFSQADARELELVAAAIERSADFSGLA
jgi:GAF domain-containing protein